MTTERAAANKALMRKIVGAFATGDVSDVDALIDRDYVDHQGVDGIALTGPGGFTRVVEGARRALADLHVTIVDLIAEDDRVVARIRWRGRGPDGHAIDRETLDIVRFAEGRAVEHWGAGVPPSATGGDADADR